MFVKDLYDMNPALTQIKSLDFNHGLALGDEVYVVSSFANQKYSEEVWKGTVAAIQGKAIYLACDEYHKDGTVRTRYKPKQEYFIVDATRAYLLFVITSAASRLRAQAQARKQYAGSRNMLRDARVASVDAFAAIGLSRTCSADDFKKVQRSIMVQFHPDRKPFSKMAPEEFDSKSAKMLGYLSDVSNHLKAVKVI